MLKWGMIKTENEQGEAIIEYYEANPLMYFFNVVIKWPILFGLWWSAGHHILSWTGVKIDYSELLQLFGTPVNPVGNDEFWAFLKITFVLSFIALTFTPWGWRQSSDSKYVYDDE